MSKPIHSSGKEQDKVVKTRKADSQDKEKKDRDPQFNPDFHYLFNMFI